MAPIKRLLVVFAMEQEGQPLVDSLGLTRVSAGLPGLPAIVHQGTHKDAEVTVIMAGTHPDHPGVQCVGTVPAAVTVYAAVHAYKPDLVLNAGTAGGFASRGAAICDVYIATSTAFHDRRIDGIPGYAAYGRAHLAHIPVPLLLSATGWKSGTVTSSDALDHTPEDDKRMADNNASVKDMEAAAIAYVTGLIGLPLLSLKVVTDIVDGPRATPEEFLANLSAASARLAEAVPVAIAHLAGREPDSL